MLHSLAWSIIYLEYVDANFFICLFVNLYYWLNKFNLILDI